MGSAVDFGGGFSSQKVSICTALHRWAVYNLGISRWRWHPPFGMYYSYRIILIHRSPLYIKTLKVIFGFFVISGHFWLFWLICSLKKEAFDNVENSV